VVMLEFNLDKCRSEKDIVLVEYPSKLYRTVESTWATPKQALYLW
jgi:hypothetical protein